MYVHTRGVFTWARTRPACCLLVPFPFHRSAYTYTQTPPINNTDQPTNRAERAKQGGDSGPNAEELEAEIDSLLTFTSTLE